MVTEVTPSYLTLFFNHDLVILKVGRKTCNLWSNSFWNEDSWTYWSSWNWQRRSASWWCKNWWVNRQLSFLTNFKDLYEFVYLFHFSEGKHHWLEWTKGEKMNLNSIWHFHIVIWQHWNLLFWKYTLQNNQNRSDLWFNKTHTSLLFLFLVKETDLKNV